MEYSPMTMSMKGVFNLLERINLRNTGRSGLDDKVRFEEKISKLNPKWHPESINNQPKVIHKST